MNRPVVARATSSDDSPVPGYLYGEIAQMTHANFEGCRQLTVYLLERIKKPNHNIKFKCLQIIKHVCNKGRTDFKISMQREAQVIKDCLSFSGPPDPLRGEEIYRRVREAAKETLDAVFAESLPAGAIAAPTRYASGNRIEGFGSGAADGGPGTYNGGAGGGPGGPTAAETIGAVGSAVGSAHARAGELRSVEGRSREWKGKAESGSSEGGSLAFGSGLFDFHGRLTLVSSLPHRAPSPRPHLWSPQDKTWLERTSETVKGSVGTGLDAVQRRLSKSSGAGGDASQRYVPQTGGGDGGFYSNSYMTNRGPNAYNSGGGGESGYRSEAVSSAYESARASSQAYASQWNQGISSGGSGSGIAPVGVRGVWGGGGGGGSDAGGNAAPPSAGHQAADDDASGQTREGGSGGREGHGGGAGASAGRNGGFVGRTGGGDADGGYEGKLVEEICSAGGTKSIPLKTELDGFLSKAASLDPGRVSEALLVALEAADWRSRSKALAVVEALHRSDPSYRIPLEDAFQDPEGGVVPLCGDSKPAVRDRAVRVSKLLGLHTSSAQAAAAASAAAAAAATASPEDPSNGYSTAPDGDPSSHGAGTTAAAPSGPAIDLLGGFSDDGEDSGGGGEGGAGTAGGDILGGAGGGGEVADIFGLHDDGAGGANGAGDSTASAGVGEASDATVGSGPSGGFDFLSMGDGGKSSGAGEGAGCETGEAAADAPADVDGLFGDLSVKEEIVGGDGQVPDASAEEAAAGGGGGGGGSSGFSFMGGGGGEAAGGDAAAAEPSTSARDAGADLLSGFGGGPPPSGTVSDMLTMSPGQNGDAAEDSGSGDAPQRKKPIATDDDWMGLSGNGQGPAKAGAVPTGDGRGAGGEGSAPASSGSLLDDWASGGGGGTKAADGVDRNLMLQQKVMLMQKQQQAGSLGGGLLGSGLSSFPGTGLPGVGGGVPAANQYNNSVVGGFHQPHRAGVMGAGGRMGGMGMRPAGVGSGGGGLGVASAGSGKVIPDVSALGSGAGTKGWQQSQKGQGQGGKAEGEARAPKAPDSFSFVMDAMQNSIK
ncbi:unnamed protein product [Scytosiphon promiscuus]